MFRLLYIFILFFFASSFLQKNLLFAQEATNGNIFLHNYKAKKDYDGHTQNWTCLQSQTGLLYVGNNEGLLEYDGAKFTRIASPGILRSLEIDKHGILYAGFKAEFGYFKPNKQGILQYYSLSKMLPEAEKKFSNVWKIYAIEDKIYFCSFEGIYLFRNLRFVKAFHSTTSFFVAFQVKNRIYVQNVKQGLAFIDSNDSLKLIKGSSVFADNYKVYNIFSHQDKIVAASRKKGFYIFNPDEIESKDSVTFTKFPVEIDSLIIKNSFIPVSRTSDNKMIVGTTSGGVIIGNDEGKLLNIINKQSGLQDNNVWDTKIDSQQNLWIPLNNGISRAAVNYPITYWNEMQGLVGNKVYCITKFENTIYLGTPQGVFYLTGNRLEKVQGSENQVWQFMKLQVEGKEKLLYACNGGVYEIKDTKATILLNDLSNYALLQPNPNSSLLYAGSRAGLKLLEYQKNKIVVKDTIKQVVGEVRKLIKNENDVWVEVSGKGVMVLQNVSATTAKPEKTKIFGEESGLSISRDFGIISDKNKILITCYNKFFSANANYDLIENNAYNKAISEKNIAVVVLQEDDKERLWIGGDCEKDNKSQSLIGYLTKNGKDFSWTSKIFKGLPNMEINAIFPDSEGIVWIGSSEGLFRYDSKQLFEPQKDFATLIRKVSLGKDSVVFGGHFADFLGKDPQDTTHQLFQVLETQAKSSVLTLDYAYNDLIFEYACPFFDNEQENEYSYYLEGFDNHWSAWTKETKKEYTNLFEKSYKFRVKARNVYGEESKEAVYAFNMLPPWYRTWWSYLLYVCVAGAAIYWIVKLNTARLQAQNIKLEKTVQERTSEVVHKNQELEQQKEEILAQNNAISQKNQNLEIAYQEINKQKEEIEAQRDNLGLANQEIKQQKEEIETQRDNIAEQKTQVEKAYQNIQTLSEIGQKITSILDIKTIISTVYENVNQLMLADAFGIGIFYPKTKSIYFEGFIENGETLPIHWHTLNEKKLPVLCFNQQKDIVINNLALDYEQYTDESLQEKSSIVPQSLIYLPLTIERKRIGIITVQSFQKNAYSAFQHTILKSLASYITIALDNAAAYETIEAKNSHITSSIRYAQSIQKAILPEKLQIEQYFPQNFVFYKPKDVVSGDFYWLSLIANKDTNEIDKLFFGVMDCTGHGVPGAFMSLIGNTLLNKIVANYASSPAQILDKLHQEIQVALRQNEEANKDGMDVGLLQVSYDAKVPKVTFAGAKRPLYVVKTGGQLLEYRGTRKSIGGKQKEDLFFENQVIPLGQGDCLYLSTDGYADQNNAERDSIGSANFKQLLLDLAPENIEIQREMLETYLLKHQAEEEQRDDITVIGIKW
jgi:serine phosphatase RsbU (regulator of sigma subunit)/ligand-binding sensor domain-containing protein